ncbi:MAG: Hsp20 family protein, partial [Candidatus Eiseniibacteriota bacterium]
DQVKATYKDGVLEIHVPKADEAKVREIEIQVS